jgi:tight adherence protein B
VTPALPYQLGAGSVLMVLLCISGFALLRAQQRRTRFQVRVAQQAAAYGRAVVATSDQTSHRGGIITYRQSILRLAARVAGLDASRRDNYPIAWWLVLPIALVLARGVVALAQFLMGPMALLLLPACWLLIVRGFYHWCDRRRLTTLYLQFPDVLAMLVRAVRVGIPIGEGIRGVARESPHPTNQEFSIVVDQMAVGVTLAEALYELAGRNSLPEYRFFATALALQSETGGALSETLERLADVIRKRVALRDHARALASEARTSIYILACLPVFSGTALALLNPDYIATLFIDPQGQRVFAAALASLAIGIASMRAIVSRSLS